MRRVLFISYYFPPSGGSGVQRPLKMVKYLPEFGWNTTVLTVDPEYASYSDLDESMFDDIPDGVRVIRSRARDPYALYSRFTGRGKSESVGVGFTDRKRVGFREKIARWIRGNFFIPDARIGWVGYATKAALKELSEHTYDAILTTGPPHSTHLIGLRVKRKTGVPWIIDLRDAWPSDSYGHLIPVSGFASARDRKLRAASFEAAERIVTVGKSISRSTSSTTFTEVSLVPNGFDEDDFPQNDQRRPSPISRSGFSIVFTGHLPDEQNPESLLDAVRIEQDAGRCRDLHLYLVGNVSRATHESIRRHNLGETVTIVPYVSHAEAIDWICNADLLLLTINRVPNPDGIITGKLYEYLASGKPVVCLGPVHGDAAELIANAAAGTTVEHGDRAGIRSALRKYYDAWEAGSSVSGASESASTLFSRRAQAKKMAAILDEITS